MRGLSRPTRTAVLQFASVVGMVGCFPSFDGLTGAAVSGDAGDPSCGIACLDGALPTCIDPAQDPGGGFQKTDFSDVSDMILNGDAVSTAGVLRLVGEVGNEVGSAFVAAPVPFDAHTSVFLRFAVRIGGGAGESGTDGMALILQSSPDGAKAIGIGGGGLAYQGIKPSIAIELDTFFNPGTDPDGNHVALLSDGNSSIHIAHASPPFRLNDGVIRNVWIDYDWREDLIEVYMGDADQRPATPLLKYAGGTYISSLGNQIYIGASAASGDMPNEHELHGKTWFVTSPLPKCR
jgi:hypothetical protein